MQGSPRAWAGIPAGHLTIQGASDRAQRVLPRRPQGRLVLSGPRACNGRATGRGRCATGRPRSPPLLFSRMHNPGACSAHPTRDSRRVPGSEESLATFRKKPAEPGRRRGGGSDRRALRRAGAAAPAHPVAPRHAPARAVRQCFVARGRSGRTRGGADRADRGGHARPAGTRGDALGVQSRPGRRWPHVRGRHRHDPRDARRRIAPQHAAAAAARRRRAAGIRRRQFPDRQRRVAARAPDSRSLRRRHRGRVPAVHRGSGRAAHGARPRCVPCEPRGRPAARGAGDLRPASAGGARHHAAAAGRDRDRRAGRLRRIRQHRAPAVHRARDRARARGRSRRPGGRLERGPASVPAGRRGRAYGARGGPVVLVPQRRPLRTTSRCSEPRSRTRSS